MLEYYKKKELAFAIILIVVFCVLNSSATYLNNMVGTDSMLFQMIFNAILTIVLLVFIFKNNLKEKYGLNKPHIRMSILIFAILFLLLSTRNIWFGFRINMSAQNLIIYLVYVFFVGIIEELLFRGFLFKAIEKDSLKQAIIIVSLTFAIGHFLHLFDANGVNLFENIMQVVIAIFYGLVFVSMFLNTKSLLPSIIMHSCIDMLSAFVNESAFTPGITISFIISGIVLCLIFSYLLLKKCNINEKMD